MRHIDLNGQWKLQYGKQEIPAMELDSPRIPQDFTMVDALVPGNVELDLMRAGHLPAQLERGNNIYDLRPLESYQWWYSRSFTIAAQDRGRAFELVLEGVDTLATIWLNGQRIATLQNMLIPHRVLMDDLLQAGENHLVIGIDSVIQAAAKRPVAPGEWAMENNWESLNIRKAAHGFGWDIMPRVISAGLWRDVYIEEKDPTRFSNVYLTTTSVNVTDKKAGLLVRWDLQATQYPMDGWTVCLSVKDPATGGSVFEKCVPVLSSHGHAAGEVEGIELWWPRGYGRPALYDISLEARDDTGGCRAEWIGRHGFRIARLEKTATTNAAGDGKFEFEVNGQRVFVKGTNWVPLDALHSRDTQHLDAALDMLVDLNCNMVRCWGGNVYEGEDFFSRCDKEGIMVWQDFAFGCALYPQTPSFHEKVRREAEAIIPMLRNHPSLVLWAGNNEIDAFYAFAKPEIDPNEDDHISREVLAGACRRLDPSRDYLPSSPYFAPELWAMGAPHEARPEDHLWGPRDDFKGSFYTSSNAHFVSEAGYHGCPNRTSLERMMNPDKLWPWQDNEEWLTHAVRPMEEGTAYNFRITLMANQIKILFGTVPEELDDFVFASQVSQAEALKFFIERFRMDSERRSGILWWNLRDGWPQISDAVVDYYGARKRAYAVIKRIQQDVCVMIGEAVDDLHPVVAVNDSQKPVTIRASVCRDGECLLEKERQLPANGSVNLGRVPAATEPAFYEISWQGEVSGENHYLAGPRPFDVATCRDGYAAISREVGSAR